MAERLSLIIFGATGFTGKYAVERIHEITKNDKSITWAIAGRSHSKLENVIKDIETKTGDNLTNVKIIIADVNDFDSLKEMSRQAKVIVNCCGPYRFYGETVIKACIETKTNHVDVSGETTFMEKMQLLYNEKAQKAGVYIISACGFDSIPADLGVIFLEQNFKGIINSIESYLKSPFDISYTGLNSTSLHYGTWESLVNEIATQNELEPMRRQIYPESLPEMLPKLNARPIIHKCKYENLWCVPFLGSDSAVVNRSQRFLYENEKKRPVQFNPYIGLSNFIDVILLSIFGAFLLIMAQFKIGRDLLLKYPRFFSLGHISHDGPSERDMNNSKLSMLFCAEGWDESDDINETSPTKKMRAKVSGINPGYGLTCTTLLYSAITIVKESDKMPGRGGVLAPGAAFSKTNYIKNLNENGVKFEILK